MAPYKKHSVSFRTECILPSVSFGRVSYSSKVYPQLAECQVGQVSSWPITSCPSNGSCHFLIFDEELTIPPVSRVSKCPSGKNTDSSAGQKLSDSANWPKAVRLFNWPKIVRFLQFSQKFSEYQLRKSPEYQLANTDGSVFSRKCAFSRKSPLGWKWSYWPKVGNLPMSL